MQKKVRIKKNRINFRARRFFFLPSSCVNLHICVRMMCAMHMRQSIDAQVRKRWMTSGRGKGLQEALLSHEPATESPLQKFKFKVLRRRSKIQFTVRDQERDIIHQVWRTCTLYIVQLSTNRRCAVYLLNINSPARRSRCERGPAYVLAANIPFLISKWIHPSLFASIQHTHIHAKCIRSSKYNSYATDYRAARLARNLKNQKQIHNNSRFPSNKTRAHRVWAGGQEERGKKMSCWEH